MAKLLNSKYPLSVGNASFCKCMFVVELGLLRYARKDDLHKGLSLEGAFASITSGGSASSGAGSASKTRVKG